LCSNVTGMVPWARIWSMISSPFFWMANTLGLRWLLAFSRDWGGQKKYRYHVKGGYLWRHSREFFFLFTQNRGFSNLLFTAVLPNSPLSIY
jgi:hypothetical protein